MRKLALIGVAAVVALGGCTSDDDSDTNTGVGDTGAPTTSVQNTGTISPATTERETETDDD